mmetsp:Transcript_15540/g.38477  ORF Transcript_15540/g.38477 Transcript_15540/m.38477 type:complete len:95 (+) Transcript_15540:787-1071(+)
MGANIVYTKNVARIGQKTSTNSALVINILPNALSTCYSYVRLVDTAGCIICGIRLDVVRHSLRPREGQTGKRDENRGGLGARKFHFKRRSPPTL